MAEQYPFSTYIQTYLSNERGEVITGRMAETTS